jgi:hypothetical protein
MSFFGFMTQIELEYIELYIYIYIGGKLTVETKILRSLSCCKRDYGCLRLAGKIGDDIG